MNCFVCAVGKLEPAQVALAGERCGERFVVQTAGLRCAICGFETVDGDQSADFTRLISDAYRREKGLLTSDEIRGARKRLGMTQSEFADYVHVGVASVKRWESGQIQDKAMDRLLRLSIEPRFAKLNAELVAQRSVDRGWGFSMVDIDYGNELPSMTIETGERFAVEGALGDLAA